MSSKPRTTSDWNFGTGTSAISARRTVTSVDSLPTSARATSKPFSGSRASRL
ncbi:hypothetical protein [Nonomuraea jabiensis]|uniref:Uncharacterized protein n=1 Tax=Nonomuraea jabiensis TaxID=882448 RepID=A0A7W9GF91_9ACTN|nr:hypothetical protein [Nonomuraea jabiensis]MBB5782749.1 hypothetical protein [Nonomuraea jabiensis]